jgi:hypothetical protein
VSEFYDHEEEMEADEYLQAHGLLGQEIKVHCEQEPSDFLTIRRIGSNLDTNMDAVISLVTQVSETSAANNKITGGIMLTPATARIVAASLLNAADEIEGFMTMFRIVTKDIDE